MKKLLLAFCAMSILACKQDPKIDYVLLSGKIENSNSDKALVSGLDFKKEITIKSDGSFSDTLRLEDPGYYSFTINRENTAIYLKNGDNLNVNIDHKTFDESIKYSGQGAVENNYLAGKYLNNEKLQGTQSDFYSVDEANFKSKIETIQKTNQESLKNLKDADENFVKFEQDNLIYDNYFMLNSYEKAHAFYTKDKEFKVSDTFIPDSLKNIVYDNPVAYKNSDAYKQLAIDAILTSVFDKLGDDFNKLTAQDLSEVKDVKIPALKNDIIEYLGKFLISPANPNMKEVHDFLVENSTNEKVNNSITATYNKIKGLVKGNPSPEFVNYENHKGGTTSLNDLKGKYVYVDVWATWCGPCKREIPFLKEVEKKYHGKNIEFVSTSIDVAKDHNTWVEMVKNEKLGGIQLMADNNWKSKFVTDYAIEGIPRFILIDPNGNIVSADAPRPSSPILIELFNELKI